MANKNKNADDRVSIHAPHEGERPGTYAAVPFCRRRFNPRSPRGGATAVVVMGSVALKVSIHAPHEGERR